jgi:hypothetical protein
VVENFITRGEGLPLSGTGVIGFQTTNAFGTSGGVYVAGGSSTYSNLSGDVTISGDADWTIEALVRDPTNPPNGYGLSLDGTGDISVFAASGALITRYNGSNVATSGTVLTVNTWHHVAMMKSGNNVYGGVDGVWETTYDATAASLGTCTPILGTRFPGDTSANNGKLFSNFRVSNAAIYSTSSYPTATDLFTS